MSKWTATENDKQLEADRINTAKYVKSTHKPISVLKLQITHILSFVCQDFTSLLDQCCATLYQFSPAVALRVFWSCSACTTPTRSLSLLHQLHHLYSLMLRPLCANLFSVAVLFQIISTCLTLQLSGPPIPYMPILELGQHQDNSCP